MSDLVSREFLTDFIDYSNRNKKDLAYVELVQKYSEVDSAADRNAVVKKINYLRIVYKKELGKINSSLKSGAGVEEVYKPKLWYFPLLQFLSDQDSMRQGSSTMEEDDNDEGSVEESRLFHEKSSEYECETGSVPSATPALTDIPTSLSSSRPPMRKRSKNTVEQATTEVLQLVGQKLTSIKEDDTFDTFGKYVAGRLRKINSDQNKFAQKLIRDVLYEPDMDFLNRNSVVTPEPSSYENHQPFPQHVPNYSAPPNFAPATSTYNNASVGLRSDFPQQNLPGLINLDNAKSFIDNYNPNTT